MPNTITGKVGATLEVYELAPAFEKSTVLLQSKKFHMRNYKKSKKYTLKYLIVSTVQDSNTIFIN